MNDPSHTDKPSILLGVAFLFLKIFSSLRLTVILLGASIFIVFAGTVAQIDKGIWFVVSEYFRTVIAWIPLNIFFPRTWDWIPQLSLPFPGGWLIGALLVINLTIAHILRFRIQAKGKRLWAGICIIVIGILSTWVIISNAFDTDSSKHSISPYWRISWQLIQGTVAGGILLAGCILLFRKLAGMILLHSGIILLMISELLTGLFSEEARMTIIEGATVNWVEDIREVECVVMDTSHPDRDDVIAIRESNLKPGSTISPPQLQFNLKVNRFLRNSQLYRWEPSTHNPATEGVGLEAVAKEITSVSGVAADEGVDMASVYIDLIEKNSGQKLGTWLLSTFIDETQPANVQGKEYRLCLRFKRTYKPYSIHLIDFRFDRYPGTNEPRNYSSDVRLTDPTKNIDRKVKIWMNNPLRYGGDTLYQASFIRDESGTVLQVVKNPSWMIPYVSCMIVAIGMLTHFGISLSQFLNRKKS
ncbi:MAG: cytochrome c biogenesis protein ResB [Planctomycetes bacterium]|nr:cytochrome c biogenesis protein ResB [Planctomycetota bacterium]